METRPCQCVRGDSARKILGKLFIRGFARVWQLFSIPFDSRAGHFDELRDGTMVELRDGEIVERRRFHVDGRFVGRRIVSYPDIPEKRTLVRLALSAFV